MKECHTGKCDDGSDQRKQPNVSRVKNLLPSARAGEAIQDIAWNREGPQAAREQVDVANSGMREG